jgi:hypothetical protein
MLPPVHFLSEQTLGAPAATVTFNNINVAIAAWDAITGKTSRHLVVMVNAACADAVNTRPVNIQFNNDAGANYNTEEMAGINAVAGPSVEIDNTATPVIGYITGTNYANASGSIRVLMAHAFNAINHKSGMTLAGAAEDTASAHTVRWASNNAITRVDLLCNAGASNFVAGSYFAVGVVDERYQAGEVLLGAAAANVTFAAIPQVDGDLMVISYLRTDLVGPGDNAIHQFNGDAVVANYWWETIAGDRNLAVVGAQFNSNISLSAMGNTGTANAFDPSIVSLPDYIDATLQRTGISFIGHHELTTPRGIIATRTLRWNNANAITHIRYLPSGGANFMAGSLFSLYLIPKYQIKRIVLTAAAASVAFNNIPQNVQRLMLTVHARTDRAAATDTVLMAFNGDNVAGNYDYQEMDAAVAVVTASRNAASLEALYTAGNTAPANQFADGSIIIPNYAGNTFHKSTLNLNGVFETRAAIRSTRWENTNPITDIVLTPGTGPNFLAGSVFELIGVGPPVTQNNSVAAKLAAIGAI